MVHYQWDLNLGPSYHDSCTTTYIKLALVLRRMHVAPAKAKPDRRTKDAQSDPYLALCFAGTTKTTTGQIA